MTAHLLNNKLNTIYSDQIIKKLDNVYYIILNNRNNYSSIL